MESLTNPTKELLALEHRRRVEQQWHDGEARDREGKVLEERNTGSMPRSVSIRGECRTKV